MLGDCRGGQGEWIVTPGWAVAIELELAVAVDGWYWLKTAILKIFLVSGAFGKKEKWVASLRARNNTTYTYMANGDLS